MRQWLRGRLTIGAGVVLALIVLVSWSGLPQQVIHDLGALRRLPLTSIGLMVALSCLSMLISGGMWSRLLTLFGYQVPARAGLKAFLAAGLAGTW